MLLASLCAGLSMQMMAYTVILDAGHGGKDFGCIGKLTNEKTVTLAVAQKLSKLIKESYPEVNVVLTRDNDRFVSLNDRATIANKANADLFISIHVNSIDKRTRGRENVHGASVYALGLHRNDDNLAVAMRENSAIELEPDFSETYQGFDPNSSESYIIFELSQNRNMHNSLEFADMTQQKLVKEAGRADKGVRQAGFLVLRATSMPAVLIELDFICNPAAERFLASENGKNECAAAIANAFSAFYAKHGIAAGNIAENIPDDSPQHKITVYKIANPEGKEIIDSPTFSSLKDAKKFLRQAKKTHPEAFIIKE